MDIIKEDINELNSLIRIRISPADYQKDVESAIKKFQKSATMPGFRPGNVPVGMIKKMHGKSFLADELNKIVSKSLSNFLIENKISVLGDPLPKENEAHDNNFDHPSDFEFLFEVGMTPKFDLNFSAINPVDFHVITVDEKRIDTYVDDMRRRHGKFSNPETADVNCILYGELIELDEAGIEKEGGIKNTSTIAIDLVKDEATKNKLIGSKKGDEVVFNPMHAMKNATEVAYMLRITTEQAEKLTADFKLKISSVNLVEKLDIGQELFDKAYGKDAITTEEQFRERVKNDIAAMFASEAKHKFNHDVEDALLHQLQIKLPDDFLKRWILSMNEKPITQEQLETEYPMYARELKWNMIENRVAQNNEIKIEEEDLLSYARAVIHQQFGNYSLGDDMMNDFAKRYLENADNKSKAERAAQSKKVFDILEQSVPKNVKEVTLDEFQKIVKEHTHHH